MNGVEHKLKDYIGKFKEVMEDARNGEPVTYTFSSSTHTGGQIQSIMIALYKRAKRLHERWVRDREVADQQLPKVKQLQIRLHPTRIYDDNHSPFLCKITECLKVIEELEADSKGVTSERVLSNLDKYKLAVQYMGMLQNPAKYAYLDRFLVNTDNIVTLDLPPSDKARYIQLQKEIEQNNEIKEGFRQMR